jgi:glutamine cyclotransferase
MTRMVLAVRLFLGSATVLVLQACSASEPSQPAPPMPVPPVYGYEVVREYPHDPEAFTQGLIFRDGFLYESTGQTDRSSVRKVELETGKVPRSERCRRLAICTTWPFASTRA